MTAGNSERVVGHQMRDEVVRGECCGNVSGGLGAQQHPKATLLGVEKRRLDRVALDAAGLGG